MFRRMDASQSGRGDFPYFGYFGRSLLPGERVAIAHLQFDLRRGSSPAYLPVAGLSCVAPAGSVTVNRPPSSVGHQLASRGALGKSREWCYEGPALSSDTPSKGTEDFAMPNVKRASKGKRLSKAVPVLGIAGMSLSMAGGASASTTGSVADVPSQNTLPPQVITLGEEEISDVSLATFYVFDRESAGKPQVGEKLAWGCRGCRGCRGCARGCGGCGGCGGCCLSIGRCRIC
jgi:hypothetical protein